MSRKSSDRVALHIVKLTRSTKQVIMIASDTIAMPICLGLSFWLVAPNSIALTSSWVWVTGIFFSLFLLTRYSLYRSIVRFLGIEFLVTAFKSVTISAFGIFLVIYLYEPLIASLKIGAVFFFTSLAYVVGSRFLARFFLQARQVRGDRVIIYGAGTAGVQLSSALPRRGKFIPVAFIDDSASMHGTVLNGLEVYSPQSLPKLVNNLEVSCVLLAMPSLSHRQRRRVIENIIKETPVHVQTMPEIGALVSGSARVDEIREVDVGDLLGRDPVPPVSSLLQASIRGKSVLVTGAGGSIGSELCRQISVLEPLRLVMLDISEASLYTIDKSIRDLLTKKGYTNLELIPLLGSTNHKERILEIMRTYHIETVYHAAAYKHVPLVEHNMIEGIQNNILGTHCTAQAAIEADVKDFVLISSDKAVLPTNVMGATKRFSELVLQGLNTLQKNTTFSMVRFGNVLASSGSVIPLFRQQIRDGGPVTVTHPEIYRYFMTIPEAAQLVIQAGSMAKGGDVFVLDMGPPVRIQDLARKMILLMGLSVRDDSNPEGDVEVQYTGLRPAEKLYEELLIGNNVMGTEHPSIMRAEEDFLEWTTLEGLLNDLSIASVKLNCEAARKILLKGIKGYTPTTQLEDLVWRERASAISSEKKIASITALKKPSNMTKKVSNTD